MKYDKIIAVVVVVCLAATAVQAQTVAIKNASVELPDATDGSFPFFGPGSDWDGEGANGVGVWFPLFYAATPAPDLNQVTFSQFDGVTMAQALEFADTSSVTASSGEIWAVSFWADNRFGLAAPVQDMLINLVAEDDSNVFDSVVGGPQGIGLSQVEGYNFYTTAVTVAGGLGQRDGKQMTLQIIVDSPDNTGQVNLDLVSMERIPEPSSMVLALVSLGGLGLLRRKR